MITVGEALRVYLIGFTAGIGFCAFMALGVWLMLGLPS